MGVGFGLLAERSRGGKVHECHIMWEIGKRRQWAEWRTPQPAQMRTGLRPARLEPSPSSRCSYHQMQTAMRVSRCSFSRICWTCFCTVRELHPRIFPISALRFPAAIHSTTSSSRFVNGRDSGSAGRVEPAFVGSPFWRPFRVDMGVTFNSLPRESRPYALGRTRFRFVRNESRRERGMEFLHPERLLRRRCQRGDHLTIRDRTVADSRNPEVSQFPCRWRIWQDHDVDR
jgi:hypothetical protein